MALLKSTLKGGGAAAEVSERPLLHEAGASIKGSTFNLVRLVESGPWCCFACPACKIDLTAVLPWCGTQANTIIGAGILALPLAFSLVGYVGGVLMLIFCAGIADFSIDVLLSLSEATERHTYEGIAVTAFGRKGTIIVSLCVIVLNVGALTAYQIIIGDVLPPLLVGARRLKAVGAKSCRAGGNLSHMLCSGPMGTRILGSRLGNDLPDRFVDALQRFLNLCLPSPSAGADMVHRCCHHGDVASVVDAAQGVRVGLDESPFHPLYVVLKPLCCRLRCL